MSLRGTASLTIVSVTYGVGTHPRGGCPLSLLETLLKNTGLEAFRRADALSIGANGALHSFSMLAKRG